MVDPSKRLQQSCDVNGGVDPMSGAEGEPNERSTTPF